MSTIDEIKARLNIVDLVSETVKLRKAGKNYSGFCPFHPNSRTPAFVIFPDSGTWRCFGQCNEGGDIFKFVMKKEGWDFPEALRYLAEKAGVQVEPLTPERQAQDEQYERLHALLEEAVNFYRHYLIQNPAGQAALAYLKKRGLQPATIEAFGLGYAPESWDASLNYFIGKGYTHAELLQVGLVTERQEGKEGYYDRFRNRIMFPIRDPMGRMAGFGARILNPNDVPKFLNSPQTLLFDKGRLLYALDAARKPIRAQDQVVIVEGYLDAIALHQAGFTNTVSPMGTALTEDQMRLLKRFTRRVVLALDADAAGEKATLRGLEVARQSMDRSEEVAFDARGLLRHEARLQADVRVTTLPPGMDPDEVVLRDPAEWQRILESAQPVVIHVMETLASGRDIEDPKTKTEIATQVLPLIEDVPSPIERDAYRQRLARLLKVDERSLQVSGPALPGRPERRRSSPRQGMGPRSRAAIVDRSTIAYLLERQCLNTLLLFPEALYSLDRALQKVGLTRFSVQDFESVDNQMLAQLVLQSLEQDELEPEAYIQENIADNLRDLSRELMENVPSKLRSMIDAPQDPTRLIAPKEEDRIADLIDSLVRLRYIRMSENINQLFFMQQDAQQNGEPFLEGLQEMILQYHRTRDRLDRALGQHIQLE